MHEMENIKRNEIKSNGILITTPIHNDPLDDYYYEQKRRKKNEKNSSNDTKKKKKYSI